MGRYFNQCIARYIRVIGEYMLTADKPKKNIKQKIKNIFKKSESTLDGFDLSNTIEDTQDTSQKEQISMPKGRRRKSKINKD